MRQKYIPCVSGHLADILNGVHGCGVCHNPNFQDSTPPECVLTEDFHTGIWACKHILKYLFTTCMCWTLSVCLNDVLHLSQPIHHPIPLLNISHFVEIFCLLAVVQYFSLPCHCPPAVFSMVIEQWPVIVCVGLCFFSCCVCDWVSEHASAALLYYHL